MSISTYLYALGANVNFGFASLVYSHFSQKISPIWMNCYKVFVAFIFFFLTVFSLGLVSLDINTTPLLLFTFSGFVGLCIGDFFFLSAFVEIGAPRTLIIFGFQPFIMAFASIFIFHQDFNLKIALGLIFFICCLLTFSLENLKMNKGWGIKGILFALAGVFLDSLAMGLSKYAFNLSENINDLEANMFRALGALMGFGILSFWKPFHFSKNFFSLSKKNKWIVTIGSFLGTFLALMCHLKALKSANLATLTGISITTPMFSSFFECLYLKKLPSKYLIISFIFFSVGIYILIS